MGALHSIEIQMGPEFFNQDASVDYDQYFLAVIWSCCGSLGPRVMATSCVDLY